MGEHAPRPPISYSSFFVSFVYSWFLYTIYGSAKSRLQ